MIAFSVSVIFFIHNVQHKSKNFKICEAGKSKNWENTEIDLQGIQILKLAQKYFTMTINILREQKMGDNKKYKESQQKTIVNF